MLTCNLLDLVGVAQGVNEAGLWLKFGGLAKSAQEAEMLERNRVKVSSCAPVPVPSSAGLCPNSPAQSWCSRPQAWLHVCHHLFVQVSYWLLCVVTKCLVGGHSVVAGPPSQQGLDLFEDPSWGHPEWCNTEKLGLFVGRFPLFVAQEYFIPILTVRTGGPACSLALRSGSLMFLGEVSRCLSPASLVPRRSSWVRRAGVGCQWLLQRDALPTLILARSRLGKLRLFGVSFHRLSQK